MSMDYQGRASGKSITEQEGVMFAAQPVWERNRKRKGGFGRKAAAAPAPVVAPEPRSFAAERDAPMPLDRPVERPVDAPYVRAEPAMASDEGLVAPIGRPTARVSRGSKSKGMGAAALVAGVVTLGAVGAVGWMATQGGDGVPEIAPGQAEIAAAPLPPLVAEPSTPAPQYDPAMEVNPPAAAPPPRATTRAAPVRPAQSRTRPAVAAAPSAGDTAVNASATLPAGPQPYSTLNPGAAPPPAVTPPAAVTPTTPTQAAPAPTEEPAAIPSTPPTLPDTTTPAVPPTETPPTAS